MIWMSIESFVFAKSNYMHQLARNNYRAPENSCIVISNVGFYGHFGHLVLCIGRMTHICVSKLTSIGSHNGMSPDRRQVVIWTNAGIFSIRTLETNSGEIVSEIKSRENAFENVSWKMAALLSRPQCVNTVSISTWCGRYIKSFFAVQFVIESGATPDESLFEPMVSEKTAIYEMVTGNSFHFDKLTLPRAP